MPLKKIEKKEILPCHKQNGVNSAYSVKYLKFN